MLSSVLALVFIFLLYISEAHYRNLSSAWDKKNEVNWIASREIPTYAKSDSPKFPRDATLTWEAGGGAAVQIMYFWIYCLTRSHKQSLLWKFFHQLKINASFGTTVSSPAKISSDSSPVTPNAVYCHYWLWFKITLTLWSRNYYFFLISAHPVYKMWIVQEPNKLALWNKLHFEEKKTESIEHV